MYNVIFNINDFLYPITSIISFLLCGLLSHLVYKIYLYTISYKFLRIFITTLICLLILFSGQFIIFKLIIGLSLYSIYTTIDVCLLNIVLVFLILICLILEHYQINKSINGEWTESCWNNWGAEKTKIIKLYGTKELWGEIYLVENQQKKIIKTAQLYCCKTPIFSLRYHKLLIVIYNDNVLGIIEIKLAGNQGLEICTYPYGRRSPLLTDNFGHFENKFYKAKV